MSQITDSTAKGDLVAHKVEMEIGSIIQLSPSMHQAGLKMSTPFKGRYLHCLNNVQQQKQTQHLCRLSALHQKTRPSPILSSLLPKIIQQTLNCKFCHFLPESGGT